MLALVLAGLLQAAPTADVPAWQRLWEAGERVAAADLLEQQLADGAPGTDPVLLAGWQLALHRYEAARETARGLGPAGRATRARAAYLLGDYEVALTELDPDDPLEARMLVDALEVLGRDDRLGPALEAAERVLGPDDPELLAVRGRHLARLGEHGQAVAAFRRALRADPLHTTSLHGLGRSLLRLGEREEATRVLERHRELVPLIDARDYALRALDLAPLHAANHAQLGDVERQLGRLERAEACYRRAAELSRGGELTPVVLRHARLLVEDRDDLDGALALLDDAVARLPDPRLPVRAGDLLLEAGRAGEALDRYERADGLRPGDAQIGQRLTAARAALERDG